MRTKFVRHYYVLLSGLFWRCGGVIRVFKFKYGNCTHKGSKGRERRGEILCRLYVVAMANVAIKLCSLMCVCVKCCSLQVLFELVIDGQDNGTAQSAQNIRSGALEESLRAFLKKKIFIFSKTKPVVKYLQPQGPSWHSQRCPCRCGPRRARLTASSIDGGPFNSFK